MGAPMSPSLADLRMFEIISDILQRFPYRHNILHLSVYRDDGFILFNNNKENLIEFFNIANNIHPLIKFTHEISSSSLQFFSSSSLQFLDITIFKGSRFRNNQILDVKLYRKPTENFQYLERNPAHPQSVFNGFLTGEIIRIIRSSNNSKDITNEINVFKNKLLQRGYKEKEIDDIIKNTENKDRKNCLHYKVREKRTMPPLVIATKFNPVFKQLGKAIRKHWQLIENDNTANQLFSRPPIIAYKKHNNLKEYLTFSKLRNNNTGTN